MAGWPFKMRSYDSLVVGSGISGMTLALLLGMNGHSVLLIEKNPHIGGAMKRFVRQGIPFDTGFHFTGGFYKNGILHDMLMALEIHNDIKPVYLSKPGSNQFIFESEQVLYELPPGFKQAEEQIKAYFPSEAGAVKQYFNMVADVCKKTVSMDLRKIALAPEVIDEDYISLDKILNDLTDNPVLKGLLAAYCMCYGVKPSEISFADHSRVCYSLYESVARVENGGDAFINALKKQFAKYDIDIMRNTCIKECADIQNRHVGRFILNNGAEIACKQSIFTVHPKIILETLPQKHLTKAFVNRVNLFEPSNGFFSVYGIIENNEPSDTQNNVFEPAIISLFPTSDVNKLLSHKYTGLPALVIMKSLESFKGKMHRVINVSEVSFSNHVSAWKNSRTKKRPPEYLEYKKHRIKSIHKRIIETYPEYKKSYKIIDAASMLTFKDYLNSPYGSAYGVKQKIGQINLFGRLALRNVYAAGQSSVLPGLVGSMLSSFVVSRNIIGKENFNNFIKNRLSI